MLNTALTVAIEGTALFGLAYFAAAFVARIHDRLTVPTTTPQPTVTKPAPKVKAPAPEPAPKPQKTLGEMLRHEVTRRESVAPQKALDAMKWVELVAIAKGLKVKRYKSLKKVELIEAIAALS